MSVVKVEKGITTVTITMTEQEAGILLAILNRVGGEPARNGKPLPRGLIDAWHDGGEDSNVSFHPGIRRQLQDAGIRKPNGLEIIGESRDIVLESYIGYEWGG